MTTEPLQLTPVQRRTIYRTIVRERVSPARPTVEYRVGTRVPENVQLYAVPQDVAVEVPAIRSYKYMVVNDRIVLIDPATSEVVEELVDNIRSHRLTIDPVRLRAGSSFLLPRVYLEAAGLLCACR